MFHKRINMSEPEDSPLQVKLYTFVFVYSSMKTVNPYEGGWGKTDLGGIKCIYKS